MTASIWLYLLPAYVLVVLLLLVGTFALLGRIQGGKYLRPIVQGMAKVPLLKRGMQKASTAALPAARTGVTGGRPGPPRGPDAPGSSRTHGRTGPR